MRGEVECRGRRCCRRRRRRHRLLRFSSVCYVPKRYRALADAFVAASVVFRLCRLHFLRTMPPCCFGVSEEPEPRSEPARAAVVQTEPKRSVRETLPASNEPSLVATQPIAAPPKPSSDSLERASDDASKPVSETPEPDLDAPEPVADAPEPVADSPDPASDDVQETASDNVIEPASEDVIKPASDDVQEPDSDDFPEPSSDDVPELASDDVPEPASGNVPEPVSHGAPESFSDVAPEPSDDDAPEPSDDDALDPSSDALEPASDNTPDPVSDDASDPVSDDSDESPSLGIRERCEELQLTDEQLREYMTRLLENIERGLRRDTHDSAIVKCFVTYVQDLPNGTERGRFMALDLGGTNFRVLLIELGEHHHFDMKSKIFAIPDYIMTGPGKQLFDHIADCLATFMKEHNLENECLPLGFTFSFPCTQVGLTKGLLVRWTKGFDCDGVIGEDVVKLLQESIAERKDIKIDVMAILNDTTGTLMSCAWKKHDCKIGLIVGTGSNACYVEKIENAEMFEGDKSKPSVLINTEWGAFGDDGALDFVRTEYDRDIDENSINPGKQVHEKMISGMYMGELVRLVLVKMTNDKLLFNGQGSDLLFKRGNFFTKYVSEIESDKKGSYTSCRQVLEELGLGHATDQDCANVRYICQVVSSRAAHLASAGVATLINKVKEENVTVGIDGSVYRFHPHFHHLMMEKIGALVQPGLKFDIMLSEDGSGRGAALVAAVASRENQKQTA